MANRLKENRIGKRTIILMIVVATLASLNLYLYSELIQTRSVLSEAREELNMVSGIIVSLRMVEHDGDEGTSYIGLLRLTTNDGVNGVMTGEISDYRIILDKYVELEVGNLVNGIPMKQEIPAIKVEYITPFFYPPLINKGEHIAFEAVELNTVGPSFYLKLQNLGEKDIISVRAEVNATLIPFFFGVDKEHPVKPYEYMSDSVPTSWFDPATNGTVGFKLIHGETYHAVVKIILSEDPPVYPYRTVKTYNFSVTAISFGSIVTIFDTGTHIEMESAYLFENLYKEDFLLIEILNVWVKAVTGIKILVDDVQVAAVKTNMKEGDCWKACIGLPIDIYVGSSHNVTVYALMAEGEVAEVSKEVKCQRM